MTWNNTPRNDFMIHLEGAQKYDSRTSLLLLKKLRSQDPLSWFLGLFPQTLRNLTWFYSWPHSFISPFLILLKCRISRGVWSWDVVDESNCHLMHEYPVSKQSINIMSNRRVKALCVILCCQGQGPVLLITYYILITKDLGEHLSKRPVSLRPYLPFKRNVKVIMSYTDRKWLKSHVKSERVPFFRWINESTTVPRSHHKHRVTSKIPGAGSIQSKRRNRGGWGTWDQYYTCSDAFTADAQVKAASIIRKRFSGDIGLCVYRRIISSLMHRALTWLQVGKLDFWWYSQYSAFVL